MIAVITDCVLRGISFTLEIAFKPGKQANIFFALKKSEQAEIVAFNRLLVNYNIHFSFYRRGDQTSLVDSCDTGQKKYGMEERMILVKVIHGFSRFFVKTRNENNIYLIHQFIIGNVVFTLKENG